MGYNKASNRYKNVWMIKYLKTNPIQFLSDRQFLYQANLFQLH